MPNSTNGDEHFFQVKDGSKIYFYDYRPLQNHKATIFIISGITGINHLHEKEIILQLSNNQNRVVVIHPRGTGYSEGRRGDISEFSLFINDYIEIITQDSDYNHQNHPLILFGHSMSCAILMAISEKVKNISGVILINPAYLLKTSKGISPSLGDYLKYAFYYIFAKHKPIVNMAGKPELIENDEDRHEAILRASDPLLVKYFSLYMMMEARKIMQRIPNYSEKSDFPLLLLYGLNDSIVDKKGCDVIFEKWKHNNKQYHLIENGAHGQSTVRLADGLIKKWLALVTKA